MSKTDLLVSLLFITMDRTRNHIKLLLPNLSEDDVERLAHRVLSDHLSSDIDGYWNAYTLQIQLKHLKGERDFVEVEAA